MITAVVLTKNEEKNIAKCLRSLAWCNEIVIVDDNSTDTTLEIIKSFQKTQIHIYTHALTGNFADQRNYGLAKAKHEWVFFIDADERVTSSLQFEIVSTINNSIDTNYGYTIRRQDVLWGKKMNHGESGKIRLLRLAKKNAGVWKGIVHETWEVKGKVSELKSPLLHYPHENISGFLKKINYYTDIRAEELYVKRVKFRTLDIIFFPLGKFVQNYFLRLGFLDGIPGIISSILMSLHSFLVRGKLWQMWQTK